MNLISPKLDPFQTKLHKTSRADSIPETSIFIDLKTQF